MPASITITVPDLPTLPANASLTRYRVEHSGASYPYRGNYRSLPDALAGWIASGTANMLMAVAHRTDADGETEFVCVYDAEKSQWCPWSGGVDDAVVPLGTADAEYDAAPITTDLTAQ